MAETIETHLDQYRLLTTTLQIRAPHYIGIEVQAEIVPDEYSQPELVRARVLETLRGFLSPLAITAEPGHHDDLMGPSWEGWPFGRDLYLAEIFSLIQRIPGVKHVLDVQLSRRPVSPSKERAGEAEGEVTEAEAPLTVVKQKVIRVSADTLLCSLNHEIIIKELGEADDQS